MVQYRIQNLLSLLQPHIKPNNPNYDVLEAEYVAWIDNSPFLNDVHKKVCHLSRSDEVGYIVMWLNATPLRLGNEQNCLCSCLECFQIQNKGRFALVLNS